LCKVLRKQKDDISWFQDKENAERILSCSFREILGKTVVGIKFPYFQANNLDWKQQQERFKTYESISTDHGQNVSCKLLNN